MLEIARFDVDRSRLGWWTLVLTLAAVLAYIFYSFIGTIVLGVFLYYAARPIHEHVRKHSHSDGLGATVTILGIILPILALLTYAGLSISGDLVTQFEQANIRRTVNGLLGVGPLPEGEAATFQSLIESPVRTLRSNRQEIRQLLTGGTQIVGIVVNWLLHVSLALTLAFYLLRDGPRLETLFRQVIGGSDTTIYRYMTAVDRDLETIFFGNVLFVIAVAVLAAVVYLTANFFAPAALRIPLPFVLAALTGISALIPLVVSKVVYVPLVLYVGYQATITPGASLTFPAVLLVVSFLLLDIAPQMLLQPYITGRKIQMGLMLFAYIFGLMLFGWYGMFYLPLLLVLGIQAFRMVVLELVHGEPITSDIDVEQDLGSDPADGPVGESAPDDDASAADGGEAPVDEETDDGDRAANDDR